MKLPRIPIFVAALTAAGPAVAEEQDRQLESSRFLGRGNTFVAAYDSDEATRANPATLSETNVKFQVRWLQIDGMVGENSVDTFNDVFDFMEEEDSSAVALLQEFSDKFGKRQYARGQISPVGLRVLWFEMSPFAASSNYVDMRVPTTPEVLFRSDTSIGMNLAFGMPIGKSLNVGLGLRPAHRTLYRGNIEFADLLDFIDDDDFELDDLFDKREGFQIGWNVGGIWKPAPAWRFGLLVEDLGYAGNYSDFKDPPPPRQQKIDVGSNYRVDWKPWHWDLSLDLQDVGNPENLNWFRLIHMGSEIGRSYVSRDHDIGLLTGINEGYFTTGAFIDVFITRLTMSYYAVELGEYPGQRKDRRWAITLLSSMTF